MVANGVDVYFHGHDHFFAYEELDGIVYQLVPQPSDPSYGTGWLEDGNYYNNADLVNNSGHMRVTIGSNAATVEYVRAFLNGESQGGFSNRDVAYSYTIPAGQGDTTTGSFEWFLDGSDVGLTSAGENVDAIGLTGDGRLLISATGNFSTGSVTGSDQVLLVLDNAVYGENSSGDWAIYFNGATAELSPGSEDITGTWLDLANGDVYLSSGGAFAAGGISGDANDIFLCTPSALGATTTCSYTFYWNAAAAGFGSSIDGFAIAR